MRNAVPAPAAREPAIIEARPVKGPIDYAALRKSITERFPKILAKLAE